MSDLATMSKAGFMPRAVASIIDAVILLIIWIALQMLLGNTLGLLLQLAVAIGYVLGFWTTTGQTPGHKAMGLRVVRTDGTRLDLSHAMLRYVGAIVASIPFFLGFSWVAFNTGRQGWHDKLADTCVVKV